MPFAANAHRMVSARTARSPRARCVAARPVVHIHSIEEQTNEFRPMRKEPRQPARRARARLRLNSSGGISKSRLSFF